MYPPRGYNLSPSWVNMIAIMDWIYDQAGGRAMVDVHYGALTETKPEYDYGSMDGFLTAFQNSGWVQAERAGGNGTHCFLLQPGVEFVDSIRAERADPAARTRAIRDAVLRWLYDDTRGEVEWAYIDHFYPSKYGSFYGAPFTERETARATTWLRESGYLRGDLSSWGGVARPGITPLGEQVVDSDISVNQKIRDNDSASGKGGDSYAFTVSGQGHTLVAGSPHAQVTGSITKEARDEIKAFTNAYEAILGTLQLDPADERKAREEFLDLRQQADGEKPDAGVLRGLITSLQKIAVSGLGAAAGQALVAMGGLALAAI